MNRKEWLKQNREAITDGKADADAYSTPLSALRTYYRDRIKHFIDQGIDDLKHHDNSAFDNLFSKLAEMVADRECELFRTYRITADKGFKELPNGQKISYYNLLNKRQLVNKLIDANNDIYSFINRFEDWTDQSFRKYVESRNGLNWRDPRK